MRIDYHTTTDFQSHFDEENLRRGLIFVTMRRQGRPPHHRLAVDPTAQDPVVFRAKNHLQAGDPPVVIVGLADTAVKESRGRASTAIRNSACKFPMGRTTINLAPADIKKEGPSFDWPIAIGMLAASEQM